MQKIFIASLCLLLFSCHQNNDPLTSDLKIPTNSNSYQASLDSYQRVADDLMEDDCDRIEPIPALSESYFKHHSFDLEDNSGAIETAAFSNGDNIFISYSGCEDRKITITISTFRYRENKNDMNYWTAAIKNLLKEVQSNTNPTSEIQKELVSINQYLSNHSLSKQEEMIYPTVNSENKLVFEGIEEGQSNSSIIHLRIELNEWM